MLTRFVFVFVFALLSLAACARGDEPSASDATADAIAAAKVDAHDLAVVALRVPDGPTCSGVVVGPRVVLTSRACVTGVKVSDCLRPVPVPPDVTQEERDPSTLEVLTGEDVTHASPVARGLHVTYPDSLRICGSDIALLELDRDVPGAPTLLVSLDAAYVGQQVRAVGFGIRKTGGPAGHKASRPHLAVTSIGPTELVLPTSACEGDEGGPAIDEKTGLVVGVVSRPAGDCSAPDAQAVFTRTDAFAAFLHGVVDESAHGGAAGSGGAAGRPCSSAHHCPKGFHCSKQTHVCEPAS